MPRRCGAAAHCVCEPSRNVYAVRAGACCKYNNRALACGVCIIGSVLGMSSAHHPYGRVQGSAGEELAALTSACMWFQCASSAAGAVEYLLALVHVGAQAQAQAQAQPQSILHIVLLLKPTNQGSAPVPLPHTSRAAEAISTPSLQGWVGW